MTVHVDRLCKCLLMFGGLAALLVSPAVTQAGYTIETGFTNSLQHQTIGFSSVSGLTIVGDVNPPHPAYNVTVTSLDGTVLRGFGGHVGNDTTPKGATNHVVFTPQAPYAWTYFDMQLDPLDSSVAAKVKITVSGNAGVLSATLDFPIEPNSGENQQYQIIADPGSWFNSVEVEYIGPSTSGNHEFHNLDVSSLNTVPAPPGIVLAGVGFVSLGLVRLRRVWPSQVAV